MPHISLARPSLDERELGEISKVIDSAYLAQGPKAVEFEKLVGDYIGASDVVATSSATTALHLAMVALDVGSGDEVIIPSFTFPATAHVVIQQGATPVFADIDLETFNINLESFKEKITSRTKAVMPVHLFGLPANMDGVMQIANDVGIKVVEDAACALGATSQGRQCGTIGELGCFSYHPRKIITTGEGGMIITNDPEMGRRVRRLRQHGGDRVNNRFTFVEPGFNYRMSDINAAVGVVQFAKLHDFIAERRRLANLYDSKLSTACPDVLLPREPDGDRHNYQAYVVVLPQAVDRDDLVLKLRELGVETTLGTYALHAEAYIQERYPYANQDLPQAYHAFCYSLTLPLYPGMSDGDVEYVVDALEKLL